MLKIISFGEALGKLATLYAAIGAGKKGTKGVEVVIVNITKLKMH